MLYVNIFWAGIAVIEETGYHLRDAELDLFAAQICLNSESKVANYYLQKAKNRIVSCGQWGLMPRWESLNQDLQD